MNWVMKVHQMHCKIHSAAVSSCANTSPTCFPQALQCHPNTRLLAVADLLLLRTVVVKKHTSPGRNSLEVFSLGVVLCKDPVSWASPQQSSFLGFSAESLLCSLSPLITAGYQHHALGAGPYILWAKSLSASRSCCAYCPGRGYDGVLLKKNSPCARAQRDPQQRSQRDPQQNN